MQSNTVDNFTGPNISEIALEIKMSQDNLTEYSKDEN